MSISRANTTNKPKANTSAIVSIRLLLGMICALQSVLQMLSFKSCTDAAKPDAARFQLRMPQSLTLPDFSFGRRKA